MGLKKLFYLPLTILMFSSITAKPTAKDEEIEVKLQFLEYELEDFCIVKNEAEWKFLNGSEPDLKKLLEAELKESDFYRSELSSLQKHINKKFSNEKLQRHVEIFSHPGAALLGTIEFKEYRDYSIKLQELIGSMKIEEKKSNTAEGNISKPTEINFQKINKILFTEQNENELKEVWIKWYRKLEEKNQKTKYDFVQQLSILDLEAEQNGEEELSDYWLKQSDTTAINYETIKSLWKEIQPLYEKIKSYLMSLIKKNFKEKVIRDQSLIPAHLLGSLYSYDWVTAAEKVKTFDNSETYKKLKLFLLEKKAKDLYKLADNLTGELKLGYLPSSFYDKSQFSESSQTCRHKAMGYCEREHTLRVMFCEEEMVNLKKFIEIHESVMNMKYLILSGKEEEENGYLFREGPRDSVLLEAMSGFATVKAISPENFQKLFPNQTQQNLEILSLLIQAFHFIPPLPYYLVSDLWRINALQEIDAAVGENTGDSTPTPLYSSTYQYDHDIGTRELSNDSKEENGTSNTEVEKSQSNTNSSSDVRDMGKTYDSKNLTRDWWVYREKYQGIASPDGKVYEDYLQDMNIIWNKPYFSKFLGVILQFQILEHLKTENLTDDTVILQSLMQKGKSKPWQILAEDLFNITDISAKSLLNHFKPLEEFLDKRNKLKNSTKLFSFDDLDFVSQGFSLNPVHNHEEEGEKPAEGSDALFFSLAVLAAVGVVAFIVTVGRRRYQKKRRIRERQRRLAEL